MKNMNLVEIVEDWLKASDYDGLYNDIGCGCSAGDLMPCIEPGTGCVAAYRFNCSKCKKREVCDKIDHDDYIPSSWMSPNKNYCTPEYEDDSE